MKAQILNVFVVAGLAGSAIGGEVPTKVDPSVGPVEHVAYIYYNVATGEKITTLLGDGLQSPASEPNTEIWIADSGAQCISQGDLTSFFWAVTGDCPSSGCTSMMPPEWFFDWGDIAMDTVVDCVQIHWISNHPDVDLTGPEGIPDGMADGVVGFAGNWIYYDAMNGRDPVFGCVNAPLISFGFYNLPGALYDSATDSYPLVKYIVDVDLSASGSSGTSLIFEIGDTDSDLQGAAVHNANLDESYSGLPGIPDIDLDLDGLADWGWSVHFNQPGTVDVDNADGDSDLQTGIDGDPLAHATAGVSFGSPTPGYPEYDSAEMTWSWIPDGPTAGVTEDMFNTGFVDPLDGGMILEGPWFFGGLSCTIPPAPPGSGYIPAAHFQTVLYGPGGIHCCPPDLNCDLVIDFFDISFFLANSVDYNNDTVFDFFDISVFLADYAAGCP
ncbi:MAG: hypothetical protein JKY43_11860 [Phycisphaerales bacterium]|nr:hypothetical protein [Phycisphaerales bacterium]